MASIFTTVLNFLKETAVSFEWNETSYSFTFWQIAITLIVLELGIYIVARIVKG